MVSLISSVLSFFNKRRLYAKVIDNTNIIKKPFTMAHPELYKFGSNNRILENNCFMGGGPIRIGNNNLIARNSQFISDSHDYKKKDYLMDPKMITRNGIEIGDRNWIGCNSIILSGVKIGNDCVIGAGSVIRGTFGDNLLIIGNPAKVIKKIEREK